MTPEASAVMWGAAAFLVATQNPWSRIKLPRRRPHARRLNNLRDAVGAVYGTPAGLRTVARQQVGALFFTALVAVALIVNSPTAANIMASCLIVLAAWQMPLILARARERRRRQAMDLELNDTLGEMVMGVEAGMTLESVMNLYARRHDTELASEFLHLLGRVDLGSTRAAALQEFCDRTPTLGVQMFVSALQQNQKLGTPLAEVLRQQSETSRRRRRQAVEEAAAKLSLKMIFPTIFCVLPVLLIVIVGPSVVRLVHGLPG